MASKLQTRTAAANLAALKNFFGPPPVLSNESIDGYNAILTRCLDSVEPRDFIEQLLTGDVADATWEIRRYMRHKSLGIERRYREQIEYQAKKTEEEVERKKQQRARQRAEKAKEQATELDRLHELELVMDATVNDVDEILVRKPEDLDYARALEQGIEFHEKLDALLNAAVARRNNALEQLERYRNGLSYLRSVSEEIIDAEFSDAKTDAGQDPPVPSIEGAGQ